MLAATGLFAVPSDSGASVSIALTLDDVARSSALVARVTPVEATSAWEDGRIVTTTRLRVDRVLAGASTNEVSVRTFGGVVGKIGQRVEGEPSFEVKRTSIVFLVPATSSAFAVVGRAQGQLVVTKAANGREVVRIGRVGELVARAVRAPRAPSDGPLMTNLDGLSADDVAKSAAQAWERTHAK